MNEQSINLNSQWGNTTSTGNFPLNPWYNPNLYQPIVKEYYPIYYGNWNEKNKTEQSFKIVQKLIDKGKINIFTVKDFIETVNIVIDSL